MKIDQNRLNRQLEGVAKWINNNKIGTFEWVTGTGKTYGAILAMKEILKENPNASFIVAVPRDPLRDMWRKEVKYHNIPRVKVDTIHMLAKQNLSCDMLVLDELHMYVGEEANVFPLIFGNTNFNHCLGLTATLGTRNIRTDIINRYCPVVDTINLKEALREGFVANYIVYNYGIPLSQQDSIAYAKINNQFYRYFGTFNNNFDTVKECLNQNGAERFARRIRWNPGAVIGYAVKTMKYMRLRKEFLYGVQSKLNVAKEIIEQFPDKKIITFSQTTDPADKLAKLVDDAESYHSNIETRLFDDDMNLKGEKCGKNKYKIFETDEILNWKEVKEKHNYQRFGQKRLRSYILDRFKNGDIRVLCTAQALDVGYDDENVDMGIVLSGTSGQRQNIQRNGRIIRLKDDKRAIIIQLYITDTQDEKWLRNRQENSENIKTIFSTSQIEV